MIKDFNCFSSFSASSCVNASSAFSMIDKFQEKGCPTCMDIIGTLGFRYYMGKVKAQIEVSDFRTSIVEDKKKNVPINQAIASILGQIDLSM